MHRRTHRIVPGDNPDDVTLSRHLTRLRRRARAILIARYLAIAMSLAVAVGAVAIAWPTTIPVSAWAAVLAVAGVSAVAFAFMRTPDVRTIAATVDGRLHLADATVTAADLYGSRDAIARLIVRDTIARMTAERLASVFPFELGRPAMSAVIAAVVCVVVAVGVGRWSQATASSAGGMRIASSESQTSSSQKPPGTSEGSASQSESKLAPSETTPSETTPSETTPSKTTGAPLKDNRPSGSRGERPLPSQAASDLGRAQSSGSGSTGRAGSTTGRQDARQTGASPEAQAARAGRAGGSSLNDDAKGSGGVQQGGLQADATRATASFPADYSLAYRAARTRVDTAIARDEVPRSRRAYVRDYFLAIAPRD